MMIMKQIFTHLLDADVVVLVTPLYYAKLQNNFINLVSIVDKLNELSYYKFN